MEVIILKSKNECHEIASKLITRLINVKRNAVLGLATGNTPLGLYQNLIEKNKNREIDFKKVKTFNLDEYLGLSMDHHHSYAYFMKSHFFDHVNLSPKNIFLLNGMENDIPKMCEDYEKKMKRVGGIDLQILGVGTDGHIGFNEPSSSLGSRTRVKTLTEETRKDNAQFFNSIDEVPTHVVTMGIGTIMDARHCLVMAFGKRKAVAVKHMIEGAISASWPCSILQMHQKVHVFLDEDSASELSNIDYYKSVYDNKLYWERY